MAAVAPVAPVRQAGAGRRHVDYVRAVRTAAAASMGLLLAALAYGSAQRGGGEAASPAALQQDFSYTFHLNQKPERKVVNPEDAAMYATQAAHSADQQVQMFSQMSGKEPVSMASALSLNARFGVSAIPSPPPLGWNAAPVTGVAAAPYAPAPYAPAAAPAGMSFVLPTGAAAVHGGSAEVSQTQGYPGGWSKGFSPPIPSGFWPASRGAMARQQAVAPESTDDAQEEEQDPTTQEQEPSTDVQEDAPQEAPSATTTIPLSSPTAGYFFAPPAAAPSMEEGQFAAVHRAAVRRTAAVRSFTIDPKSAGAHV